MKRVIRFKFKEKNMLINAQEKAKKYPETFHVPSMDDLKDLRPGLSVKIALEFGEDKDGFSSERFWVIISSIEGDEITAIVDNELIYTDKHGFKYGDEITIDPEHVHNIFEFVKPH